METTYWLRRIILGPQNAITLTQGAFEKILNARDILRDAKDFEERYEMLLGNFLDLEKFFSDYTIESQLSFSYKYENLSVIFMDANRRVMNLLTTFKSYLDQSPRDFKKCNIPFKERFKAATKNSYDQSKAYRFISALRNHVQHHSPPVHRIKSGGRSEAWPEPIKFICEPKYLLENIDFKRAALEGLDEEIDLREQIRDFMVEMSKIHLSLRAEMEEQVKFARKIFEQTIEDYIVQQAEPASALGLAICVKFGDKYVSKQSVMLDWDDTRERLVEKNSHILRIKKYSTQK